VTTIDAAGIESPANDVVSNSRKVLDSTPPDQDNGVFLEIMPFAGNVRCDFNAIRQSDASDFSKR